MFVLDTGILNILVHIASVSALLAFIFGLVFLLIYSKNKSILMRFSGILFISAFFIFFSSSTTLTLMNNFATRFGTPENASNVVYFSIYCIIIAFSYIIISLMSLIFDWGCSNKVIFIILLLSSFILSILLFVFMHGLWW